MANNPARLVKREKIGVFLDNPRRQLCGIDQRRIERLRTRWRERTTIRIAFRLKIHGNEKVFPILSESLMF